MPSTLLAKIPWRGFFASQEVVAPKRKRTQARCSEPELREAAPGHRVACHFFETLPAPTLLARAGLANGKFAARLAAFEAAKQGLKRTEVQLPGVFNGADSTAQLG
ncbi:hypothetical protein [Bradyrhizobium retamae]|nr:hypothetical protein [Bradyrhizobium retamae]